MTTPVLRNFTGQSPYPDDLLPPASALSLDAALRALETAYDRDRYHQMVDAFRAHLLDTHDPHGDLHDVAGSDQTLRAVHALYLTMAGATLAEADFLALMRAHPERLVELVRRIILNDAYAHRDGSGPMPDASARYAADDVAVLDDAPPMPCVALRPGFGALEWASGYTVAAPRADGALLVAATTDGPACTLLGQSALAIARSAGTLQVTAVGGSVTIPHTRACVAWSTGAASVRWLDDGLQTASLASVWPVGLDQLRVDAVPGTHPLPHLVVYPRALSDAEMVWALTAPF